MDDLILLLFITFLKKFQATYSHTANKLYKITTISYIYLN